MNFKKWVKSIQTAGYNGTRTIDIYATYFYTYLMNLNTSISAKQLFGVCGTPRDPFDA